MDFSALVTFFQAVYHLTICYRLRPSLNHTARPAPIWSQMRVKCPRPKVYTQTLRNEGKRNIIRFDSPNCVRSEVGQRSYRRQQKLLECHTGPRRAICVRSAVAAANCGPTITPVGCSTIHVILLHWFVLILSNFFIITIFNYFCSNFSGLSALFHTKPLWPTPQYRQ